LHHHGKHDPKRQDASAGKGLRRCFVNIDKCPGTYFPASFSERGVFFMDITFFVLMLPVL